MEEVKHPYEFKALSQYMNDKGLVPIEHFSNTMRQFILRCGGDKWESPFMDFYQKLLKSHDPYDLMEEGEKYLENYFNREDTPLKETGVNHFWKQPENAGNFIQLLKDYRKKFDVTSDKQVLEFAKNINNDPLRYIYEILQNADDCLYPDGVPRSFILDLSETGKIIARYNECGMTHLDIISLTTLGKSTKIDREKKQIGEKGIGFKTIFSACKEVEIYSGGYSFSLKGNSFEPTFIDNNNEYTGTTLVLYLKDSTESQEQTTTPQVDIFPALLAQYGYKDGAIDPQTAFQQCPVLFTNHLDSITLKKDDFTFTVERTTTEKDSFKEKTSSQSLSLRYIFGRKSEEQSFIMDCLALSKPVSFTLEEYASRYPEQYTDDTFPKEGESQVAITYDIVIVAPIDVPEQPTPFCGNLYSFLPTSSTIKAPFNLQIPLKLNLDRSCMWYKGDQDTSGQVFHADEHGTISWNTRLWKETYGLIKDFYKCLQNKVDLLDYAPYFQTNNHDLFKAKGEKYADGVKNLNAFCKNCQVVEGENLFQTFAQIPYFKEFKEFKECGEEHFYYNAKNSAMFDPFIMNTFQGAYYKQWKETIKSGKNLVEFHEKGDQLQAWCENFQIKVEDDAVKTQLLNACFDEVEQRKTVLQAYLSTTSTSTYLPINPSGLEIFLARREEKDGEFLSFSDHSNGNRFWFYAPEYPEYYSKKMLCFGDVAPVAPTDFVQFTKNYGLNIPQVSSVKEVFTHLPKDITLNQEELEELMTFLARYLDSQSDWNAYAQKILKGQVEGWKTEEVKILAEMVLKAKGVQ